MMRDGARHQMSSKTPREVPCMKTVTYVCIEKTEPCSAGRRNERFGRRVGLAGWKLPDRAIYVVAFEVLLAAGSTGRPPMKAPRTALSRLWTPP